VRSWFGRLDVLGVKRQGDGSNRISLRLANGSRIIGLPGREMSLRGFSAVSLLIIDEAARVEDDVYRALRPMLAVGDGELWLLSTPFSKRGFFYENWVHNGACGPVHPNENWVHGGEEWTRFSVPATECPRISGAFLEEERRNVGQASFGQEYLCEFLDDGSQMFDREMVMGIFDEGEPLGL
jgi:hypothetical protein